MALSNDDVMRICRAWNDLPGAVSHADLIRMAEAETRKQDEALIRLMVAALENHQGNYKLTKAECVPVDNAITAAHARLERQHKRTTP